MVIHWNRLKQDRQCLYNIILWYVCVTTVAMWKQQYIPFLLLLAQMLLSKIKKCSVLPWKCNNGFPLHYCQATKYFVLLLTIVSIKYYECVSAFLPLVSSMQIAPCLCRTILSCVACLALPYIYMIHVSHNQRNFQKEVIEQKMCVLIFYNFCLKHFSL
jgi:hypothetical protein